MSLEPGARLGPYEIVAPLGAGGMGEVYRARDTRLEREVAIKVLPSELASEPDRLRRFEQEARAASALNHANILTVHDVGADAGTSYLVTELLAGESLRALIRRGPLLPKRAVELALQIVRGLDAAHEKGIVHRDLKPENLFLTQDGVVKILDFGLARLVAPITSASQLAQAPTIEALTGAGMVVGTVGYMAPEQVRGEVADARADLFAFGCVLYELLAGQRAFSRDSAVDTLHAILHDEPPEIANLGSNLPPALADVLLHCLEKRREKRFQSAADLVFALEHVDSSAAFVPPLSLDGKVAAPGGAGWRYRLRRRRWLVFGAGVAVILFALVALELAGSRRLSRRGETTPGAIRLAVMPVENLSGDPEQEYFSDGLTEELIARLGNLQPRTLGVIARTSVMRYKNSTTPIDRIAKELGVDYVLESSARRDAGRVRITAQLVRAQGQTQLWAESYERDLAGIFAIQVDVSGRIARSLALELLPTEQARFASARPPDPEAHDLYLKGRYHWNRRTPADLLKATELFRAATGVDPAYAQAWVGLADSYALYSFYDLQSPRESFPLAKAAVARALALEPNLVEARTAQAFISFYYDWDWAAAETQLEQVLELRPSYAIARQWYAEYLAAMGRTEAALREIRRAQELDPLSPLFRVIEAYVYFFARQYPQVLQAAERARAIDPNFSLTYGYVETAYEEMGNYEAALQAARRSDDLRGNTPAGRLRLARLYGRAGRRDEAIALLDQVLSQSQERALPKQQLVMLYAVLGRNREAMDWLDKAYLERENFLVKLRVEPRYDLLRSDPRFQDLVRRMNFPPS